MFSLRERRYGTDSVAQVLRAACRPTAVLHVANIARNSTLEDLKTAIPEALDFRILASAKGESQNALCLFDSAEEATNTLLLRHNQLVVDKAVKLSFSKSAF
jgi:hypothetical protein